MTSLKSNRPKTKQNKKSHLGKLSCIILGFKSFFFEFIRICSAFSVLFCLKKIVLIKK